MSPAIVVTFGLLAALVGTVALTLAGLARVLLRPPRMTDGKAMYVLGRLDPSDLGLEYETIRFDGRDRRGTFPIAAWWIARPGSDRTCVLVHGYGDAKVGALAWAPTWLALGFNLLLIDLRAHGESGGRDSTGGYFERDDLDAVLNQLRASKPEATRQIALFGVSLGGAVAIACAARRDDVAGVVADSVFVDYPTAIRAHAAAMRAPLQSLIGVAQALAERWSGARFADVAPAKLLPSVTCPVLLIHGEADAFVSPESVDALASALTRRDDPRDDHWRVPEAGHPLALVADPDGYARRLAAFVERLDDVPSARAARTDAPVD